MKWLNAKVLSFEGSAVRSKLWPIWANLHFRDFGKAAMLITARYRIHINSIDLNGTSQRCCGGIGFAVQQPALRLRIETSSANRMITSHGAEAKEYLARVRAVERFHQQLRVEEIEAVRPHIGLGSFTQLKLAVLKAVRTYKGQYLNEASIPAELRIGTTSGVGLGTFLYGGFILDGGYRVGRGLQKTINGEAAGKPAPVLARYSLPQDWGVLLALPKTLQSLSGSWEEEFFDSITPIPQNETREIAYRILLGILPAIREADYDGFVESIKLVCQLGAKPHELRLNPSCIPIVKALESAFGFGGISSLGPACYTFFERSRYDDDIVRDLKLRFPDFEWIATTFCNEPHGVV